jgi:hypothetical protein
MSYQILSKAETESGKPYAYQSILLEGDTFDFNSTLRVINNEINVPQNWYVQNARGEQLGASAFANMVNNWKLNEEALAEYFE